MEFFKIFIVIFNGFPSADSKSCLLLLLFSLFLYLQYWVSQGNKWCDFCKIYISNNPSSIRNHELGTRHKDAVAKKLADMRKDRAAKEKEEKEAERALVQIEAVSIGKSLHSYYKSIFFHLFR